MSGISSVAAVQARIASIESRIGVPRTAAPASGATASAAPTAPATLPEVATASTTTFDEVLDSLVADASTVTATVPAESTDSALDVPYGDLFEAAGARHGVDPALLAAVAKTESAFRPDAVSPAGAQGLMQIMPSTAAGLGVADPFDPAQAADGAARLLAGLIDQFGSVELALAAYNAGPGAVLRYGGIPPYAETQAYVPKVMSHFEEYSN